MTPGQGKESAHCCSGAARGRALRRPGERAEAALVRVRARHVKGQPAGAEAAEFASACNAQAVVLALLAIVHAMQQLLPWPRYHSQVPH